jgi:hypothetical protein
MDQKENPRLSEVLGALVSSIAYGRQVADMEALRIARRYEQNELLKGLPVPRLRLSQVNISLPVILSSIIPGKSAERNDIAEIANIAAEDLSEAIEEEKKSLNYLTKLENTPDNQKENFERGMRFLDKASDMNAENKFLLVFQVKLKHAFIDMDLAEANSNIDASIAFAVSDAAESALLHVLREVFFVYVEERREEANDFDPEKARSSAQDVLKEAYIQNLVKKVRLSAEGAAVLSGTIAPDFFVAVDTDSIKNSGGGPNAVTRIDLVLREEGLEWLSEKRDGKEMKKLSTE